MKNRSVGLRKKWNAETSSVVIVLVIVLLYDSSAGFTYAHLCFKAQVQNSPKILSLAVCKQSEVIMCSICLFSTHGKASYHTSTTPAASPHIEYVWIQIQTQHERASTGDASVRGSSLIGRNVTPWMCRKWEQLRERIDGNISPPAYHFMILQYCLCRVKQQKKVEPGWEPHVLCWEFYSLHFSPLECTLYKQLHHIGK